MARVTLGILAAALIGACGSELDPDIRSAPDVLELIDEHDIELVAAQQMLEITVTQDIDIEDMTKDLDLEVAAIAADAWLLYEELATRVYERGMTLEELVTAAAAYDVEAISEMFGWTLEEMAEADDRALALIERARAAGVGDYSSSDAVPLEGWGCGWRGTGPWLECTILTVSGIGWGLWVAGGPVIVPRAAIAILASAGLCACSFDSTDPGPPQRPK